MRLIPAPPLSAAAARLNRPRPGGAANVDETESDLLMRVEGMTCDGCADAVGRTVRRIGRRR